MWMWSEKCDCWLNNSKYQNNDTKYSMVSGTLMEKDMIKLYSFKYIFKIPTFYLNPIP